MIEDVQLKMRFKMKIWLLIVLEIQGRGQQHPCNASTGNAALWRRLLDADQ